MSSMERFTLAEIEAVQGTDLVKYFLQTMLKNEGKDGLKLTLTNAEELWEGEISETDLDKFSKRLKMDFTTYVQHTVCALTCENKGTLSFEYQLKPVAGGRVVLSWKKYVAADDIKFQLGQVQLEKKSNMKQAMTDIFCQSISLVSHLKRQAQALEVDNQRLALERQNALKRLDKCVSAKEQLEKDLYSKFASVLNSKKEMIRILHEQTVADQGRSSPAASTSKDDCVDSSLKPSMADNGIHQRNRQASESQEVDTDDEMVTQPKKQPKRKARNDEPDTSLALGEDEDDDTSKSSPVARRSRRQPAAKKPAAATIIPRKSTSTTERPSSAGKRSSLRKSGSNNSNKSYDNLDPDDLLDNM